MSSLVCLFSFGACHKGPIIAMSSLPKVSCRLNFLEGIQFAMDSIL